MSDVSSRQPVPPPRPHTRPWSLTAAVVILVLGFAILPVVVDILLSLVPTILGWSGARSEEWLLHSPTADFLFVLGVEAATLGILAWFIRRRKASFTAAVALKRLRWRDLGYTIMGIIVYFGLFIVAFALVDNIFPIDTNQEQAIGFDPGVTGIGLAMAFVSLVILPPLVEEIVFRGFFYGTLRRNKLRVPWSIFITSALFAALHLLGSTDGALLWIAFVDTFVLSLVLCYIREKTGSIWASIGVHALKNGFVFLNLFILHLV